MQQVTFFPFEFLSLEGPGNDFCQYLLIQHKGKEKIALSI
jgi:hypothetical protein